MLEADKAPTLHIVVPQWMSLLRHCTLTASDDDVTISLKEATRQELELRKTCVTDVHRMATFFYPCMKSLRMLDEVERTNVHNNVCALIKVSFLL